MRFLTYLIVAFGLLACAGDDEPAGVSPVAPSWAEGYPKVAIGATSIDLNLKTSASAEIFYILSDKPFDYSAEDVRFFSEYPDTSAIKSSGRIELNPNEENRKSIKLLEEDHEYFVYFVARNRAGTAISPVQESQARTYVRQDTASYHSVAENRTVNYLVYRPEEALKYPDAVYPVCFSFGDKASAASDIKPVNLIRDGSLAEFIYHRNDVPMIVISIQHDRNLWDLEMIAEGINHANETYPIDANRIFLTGYGEGAIACWNYAIANEQQVAAIVPVSGRGDISNACSLQNVDVWAFHNETDNTFASSNTKKMISAISKCSPQKELSGIYFPDAGHNCWKRVYNSSHADWSKSPGIEKFNIFSWMLGKSKE